MPTTRTAHPCGSRDKTLTTKLGQKGKYFAQGCCRPCHSRTEATCPTIHLYVRFVAVGNETKKETRSHKLET